MKVWQKLSYFFAFVTSLLIIAGSFTLSSQESVTAQNEGYTKSDLEQAFYQRDQAIEVIIAEVTSLQDRITKLEGGKK